MTDDKKTPPGPTSGAEENETNSDSYDNQINIQTNNLQGPASPSEAGAKPKNLDGAKLLDALASIFKKFLVLPKGAAEALALWVLFTHTFDAAEVSPRLALTSPVPGCGKTTVLTILDHVVRNSLAASNWSTATVFRSIQSNCPTLLIDEVDTFLAENDGLRGILNSGHTHSMAFVMRSSGDDYQPTQFSTWAPIAMAKIGRFPSTLEQRSIVIRMRKRKAGETIERFRPRQTNELDWLAILAASWAESQMEELRQSDPAIPEQLPDRTADNWRPLLAIADAAGRHWPETARNVALKLSESWDDPSPGVQTLAKIQDAVGAWPGDRILSEELASKIGQNQRQLARALAPFGIRPQAQRIEGRVRRGYRMVDFQDAFDRYLS
jgi:hypothetical protein